MNGSGYLLPFLFFLGFLGLACILLVYDTLSVPRHLQGEALEIHTELNYSLWIPT